jgi:flagellar L-ring protein precursor FlgH
MNMECNAHRNRTLALAGAALIVLASAAHAQGRRGSIYQLSAGPIAPTASKIAWKVGDLVTIVVSETQDLKNEESSDIAKNTSVDWQLRNFDVKPNAFSTLPRLAGSSDDEFNGTANYVKKGKFTARLTATVVDVLPNGNLVLQGRRQIRIDKETKFIEFGGIVRRWDLKGDNSVASELVANARVSYHGTGPLSNATNRRGLGAVVHDAIDWVWPF